MLSIMGRIRNLFANLRRLADAPPKPQPRPTVRRARRNERKIRWAFAIEPSVDSASSFIAADYLNARKSQRHEMMAADAIRKRLRQLANFKG